MSTSEGVTMPYEMKEGTGALFRNDKEKENQPDYRGDAKIGGEEYKIAGWIREGKRGKFLSLQIESKLPVKVNAPKQVKQQGGVFDDLKDDVPF
jgi:hypothetical protein